MSDSKLNSNPHGGRITKLHGYLLLLMICTVATFGEGLRAREGMSASLNDAPPAVRAAWAATFVYLGPNKWGTAFLIERHRTGSELELFFLTANHVVDPKCAVGTLCAGVQLLGNMRAWTKQRLTYIAQTEEPKFGDVFLIQRHVKDDLAVIGVRIPPPRPDTLPAPIPFARGCALRRGEPMYSVGFSATMDRTEPHNLITEPGVATKRWAAGLYVDRFLEPKTGYLQMVGTTVDGINGHSGSALVNAAGEVVSVFSLAVSNAGNAYDGDEAPGHLDWHSLGIACEVVQDFAKYQSKSRP